MMGAIPDAHGIVTDHDGLAMYGDFRKVAKPRELLGHLANLFVVITPLVMTSRHRGSDLPHSMLNLPRVFRSFSSKLAVQERYNQNLFHRALSGSLQGIAERPLPCNYNMIQFVSAFHGGNTGSNPVGDAKPFQELADNRRNFRRHKKAQL
jgi:hypothetical protein